MATEQEKYYARQNRQAEAARKQTERERQTREKKERADEAKRDRANRRDGTGGMYG